MWKTFTIISPPLENVFKTFCSFTLKQFTPPSSQIEINIPIWTDVYHVFASNQIKTQCA